MTAMKNCDGKQTAKSGSLIMFMVIRLFDLDLIFIVPHILFGIYERMSFILSPSGVITFYILSQTVTTMCCISTNIKIA